MRLVGVFATSGSGLGSCGGEANGDTAGGDGENGGEEDGAMIGAGDELCIFPSSDDAAGGGVGGPGVGEEDRRCSSLSSLSCPLSGCKSSLSSFAVVEGDDARSLCGLAMMFPTKRVCFEKEPKPGVLVCGVEEIKLWSLVNRRSKVV